MGLEQVGIIPVIAPVLVVDLVPVRLAVLFSASQHLFVILGTPLPSVLGLRIFPSRSGGAITWLAVRPQPALGRGVLRVLVERLCLAALRTGFRWYGFHVIAS
jgi:hypothetical protein